jgi:hypothetical protein
MRGHRLVCFPSISPTRPAPTITSFSGRLLSLRRPPRWSSEPVRLAWEGVRLTHTSSIMLLGNLPPHISFINSFWPNLLRHGPLRGASGPADKVRPLVCKEGDHHLSNRLTVLADFPII